MPEAAQAIDSPANPRVKAAIRLRERRERDETGLTLVDGGREALRAMEAGAIIETAFICPARIGSTEARRVAEKVGQDFGPFSASIEVVEIGERAFDRLAYGDRADGVVLVVRSPGTQLEDLVLPPTPLVLVTEDVEKPGNVGAILRSADAVGASAVIAVGGTDLHNPNVIRASVGTVFSVPIASAPAAEIATWLRARDIRIVASRVDAIELHVDADLTGSIAIVLGSEANGLSDAWRAPDIGAVRLPMLGAADSLNVSAAAAVLLYENRGASAEPGARAVADTFDFVIIGAGPAGEAAALEARRRGASVAIVDRRWVGGSCPHIGCLPSKSLLDSAARHHANASAWSWREASDRRDWMINRAPDAAEPDDTAHVQPLEQAGAVVYRGTAHAVQRGVVEIRHDEQVHRVEGGNIVIAVGSSSKVPPLPGLERINVWTNREATLARALPRSLLVLGGGPTGCELAQAYVRFGVPVTIIQSGDRLMPTDHPRNSAVVTEALREDGVVVRLGVRAVAARAGDGPERAHAIDLSDGSVAQGHAILLAVGRDFPLEDLGLECYGVDTTGRTPFPRDGRLRIANGLWVIGDPAGPELHTHQAHYQGEMAVRMALGDKVRPDYRALPRATYTDPEAAFVGVTLEQAQDNDIDAVEFVADFATSSRGYGVQAKRGHVTIVVDRASRTLVGAAMACPDASAAIHECVVAIRARVSIEVLADTIHAFPSTSRILNGLFADARRALS